VRLTSLSFSCDICEGLLRLLCASRAQFLELLERHLYLLECVGSLPSSRSVSVAPHGQSTVRTRANFFANLFSLGVSDMSSCTSSTSLYTLPFLALTTFFAAFLTGATSSITSSSDAATTSSSSASATDLDLLRMTTLTAALAGTLPVAALPDLPCCCFFALDDTARPHERLSTSRHAQVLTIVIHRALVGEGEALRQPVLLVLLRETTVLSEGPRAARLSPLLTLDWMGWIPSSSEDESGERPLLCATAAMG
jgi:hypothetical protein